MQAEPLSRSRQDAPTAAGWKCLSHDCWAAEKKWRVGGAGGWGRGWRFLPLSPLAAVLVVEGEEKRGVEGVGGRWVVTSEFGTESR